MTETVFEGTAAVRAAVGTHLGYSGWMTVTEAQVQAYAEATSDRDRVDVEVDLDRDIHGADGERAAAKSPTSAAVAQPYLTLALTNLFLPQVVEVRGTSLGVNRGTGTIRFPAPVPVGSRLRAGVELVAVDDVAGGIDTAMVITVERDGGDEPVCVVESLSRYLD